MNKGLVAFISLGVGGVIGYFVGKRLTEEACEERLEEEIASVKKAFRKAKKAREEKKEEPEPGEPDFPHDEQTLLDQQEYRKQIERARYRPQDPGRTEEQLHQMAEKYRPKVVSPDEFLEKDWGDAISLTYLSKDGTLLDSQNEKMSDTDIEHTVGDDFASHFGEYEDDSVFVENSRTKTYYEILRVDDKTYEDFKRSRPEAIG